MAFKTILIPIMDMAEAEESWKSRFHVINSEIGCIIAPPRSGNTHALALPYFFVGFQSWDLCTAVQISTNLILALLIVYAYLLYSAGDWPSPDEKLSMPADGMLTCTVVLPGEGGTSFEALMKSPQDVRDFFAKWYPIAFGPDGPSEEVAIDFFKRR